MAWFEFDQNNTGGDFQFDAERGITHIVIVEADDHREANDRAQMIGLYFDGCQSGYDCPCCGDRWAEQWRDEGDEVPSRYGTPLVDFEDNFGWMGENPEVFVHLKDGRFFGFHLVEGRYVYKGDVTDLVEALPSAAPKKIETDLDKRLDAHRARYGGASYVLSDDVKEIES